MNATITMPTYSQTTKVFVRIGLLSFGGPVGQIALMHRELVDELGWVEEEQFLNALNFCHLLPGPEAQQLATYIGWKLHGLRGGLTAGLLFILPGALVMLALSALYSTASGLGWFEALFTGIKAAVLAIVLQALFRIAGRSLDTTFKRGLSFLAFLCLFVFSLPFPLVVLGAGLVGAIIASRRPDWLALSSTNNAAVQRPRLQAMVGIVFVWLGVWALPLMAVLAFLGREHVLWDIGVFFSQLAVVTFGGAYAVLAYMAQEAVSGYGWLTAGEMADALGLAETTPGPLILVTQHVGFLAAARSPEPFTSFVAGLLGAGLTTWVTFVPSFLWIFTFAPWIEWLQRSPKLKGGLAAVTASIVGVIANLTLWLAIHVLFARIEPVEAGPIQTVIPQPDSLQAIPFVIALIAVVAIFRFRLNVMLLLAFASLLGLGLQGVP